MIKHAIILAGGKGERLRPLTLDRPKPMVEVGGRPILMYQVEQLKNAGVETIIFARGYKKEVLEQFWGDGSKFGIKVLYSDEDQPLGRGGAIKKAMQMLGEDFEDVFASN